MTTHEEMTERFSALVENELPPPEAMEVRAHLEGCEGCRRALEDLERTLEGLRALPRITAPPDLARRVRRRVRRRTARPTATRGSWQQELVSASVLAVLAGAVVLAAGHLVGPKAKDLAQVPPEAKVAAFEATGGRTVSVARAVVVRFGPGRADAARAFVAAAADLGARTPGGAKLAAVSQVPTPGVLLLLPEAALSAIVPEGVARLEPMEPSRVPKVTAPPVSGKRGQWIVVRVVVR